MDYEKKYKEALERARALRNEAIEKEYAVDYIKDYETIFPELCESEDERIRKELVAFFKAMQDSPWHEKYWHDLEIVHILAYLEKQKINTEGDFGRGYDCGYQAGYSVAMNEMKPKVATATLDSEKQKEEGYDFIPVKSTLEYKLGFADGRDSEKQKEQKPDIEICPHSVKSKSYSETGRSHFVIRVLSDGHMEKAIVLYPDECDCKVGDVVKAIIRKKD